MATATESYVNARAGQTRAEGQADIERAIDRLIRWIVGTWLATLTVLVSLILSQVD